MNKLTNDKLNILYIKNNKVILIDTDKIYNVKVGKMLKTYDNKYISRKVIKNEKNKLYFRHIYSLLPDDIITDIQQRIYKYIFQTKVLKIEKQIYCVKDNSFDIHNFNQEIFEFHNIDTTGRNTFTNGGWNMNDDIEEQEFNRREQEQKKEEWVLIDTFKTDLFDGRKLTFHKDNRKKFIDNLKKRNSKSKNLVKAINNYEGFLSEFDIKTRCVGLLKNGSLCGCDSIQHVKIRNHRHYFNKLVNHKSFNEDASYSNMIEEGINNIYISENQEREHNYILFGACGRHLGVLRDLRISEVGYKKDITTRYLNRIYEQLGFEVKNGYMCKICSQ